MAMADGSQIFALIAGINKYTKISHLYGAVHDATSFRNYLCDDLKVPENNIKLLTDQNATRAAILDVFDSHLLNNPKIEEKNKPLLIFYYAGHGGRVRAPAGLNPKSGKVETICPVDDFTHDANGKMIVGIPDITLNVKLDELAKKKGNNIVVILDCCHSGGAARDPLPGRVRRGVMDYDGEKIAFPDDEQKSWRRHSRDLGFRRSQQSYVLLAACQDIESAREDIQDIESARKDIQPDSVPSGIFTAALLDCLKGVDSTWTYFDLMERVQHSDRLKRYKQFPTCYGYNKDRWLFQVKARSQLNAEPVFILENLSRDRITASHFTITGSGNTPYKLVPDQFESVSNVPVPILKFQDNPIGSAVFNNIELNKLKVEPPLNPSRYWIPCKRGKGFTVKPAFIVEVGEKHRVETNSRFTILLTNDTSLANKPSETLAQLEVYCHGPQRSILVFKGAEMSSKKVATNANVSWIPDSSSVVRVYIEGSGLEDVIGGTHFTLVSLVNDADIVLSLHGKAGHHSLKVKRLDPLITQLVGVGRPFDEVDLNVANIADIPAILDRIAHFHYYLRFNSVSTDKIMALGSFSGGIKLHLYKITTNPENGMREPQDSKDYFVDRSVDTKSYYGIEISKDTDGDVCVSLVSFNARTYEIAVQRQSDHTEDLLLGHSNQGENADVGGSDKITVGYGHGGGNPFSFESGQRVFFKLFVSGDYCDWKFIEQDGVSGVSRSRDGLRKRLQDEINFKGAWVVGVVAKDG